MVLITVMATIAVMISASPVSGTGPSQCFQTRRALGPQMHVQREVKMDQVGFCCLNRPLLFRLTISGLPSKICFEIGQTSVAFSHQILAL